MEQILTDRDSLRERYGLAVDRIRQIGTEETVKGACRDYFRNRDGSMNTVFYSIKS